MEAVAVFGGSPYFSPSPSSLRSSTEISGSLSYTRSQKLILRTTRHHHHLAAFQQPSYLFSHSLSRRHVSKKPHIFLPQLVASMVCFLSVKPSFFLSAKLLRTQLNSPLVFFIFSPQEQVEETYIMIKPDGVQRGLVSFNYIYLS